MPLSRFVRALPGLLLAISLAACNGRPPPSATPTAGAPSASPTAGEARPAPSLTPTRLPTRTPEPTAAQTIGLQVIAPANAGQVTELSRLGKGALLGAADYSPDGRFLAVPTAFGVYLRIAFTPDGMRLAAGSRDGTISIWGIPAPGSIFHSLFQKFR